MRVESVGSSHANSPLRSTANVNTRGAFHETLEGTITGLAQPQGGDYTVQRGDTLSQIVQAQLHTLGRDVSVACIYEGVAEIAQANRLADPDLILAGQSLDLRALYRDDGATVAQAELPPAAHSAATAPPVARNVPPDEESSDFVLDPPRAIASAAIPSITRGASAAYKSTEVPVVNVELQETTQPAFRPEVVSERLPVLSPWRVIVDGRARLTSEFGRRNDPITGEPGEHHGIDIAAARGTDIRPLRSGEVVVSEFTPSYGNVVVVRHDDDTETLYGHNAENFVAVGDKVSPETVIATVGSTGRSTAPHVHFELRQNGKPVNPIPHLQ